MSLVQTCAEVEAAIARARALFGEANADDLGEDLGHLGRAAQSVSAAGSRAAGIGTHQSLVDESGAALAAAAGRDADLAGHLASAAAVTHAGAARIDQIAAATRQITRAAHSVRSPAVERNVLAGLRSQMAQVAAVVNATQAQLTALSAQVRVTRPG